MTVTPSQPIAYRASTEVLGDASGADPVTTEVIRHGLNAAADAMKSTLVRTSLSTTVFEALDFAAALYDRNVRLLGQALSMPLFMGTMGYCVEAAVAEVGGEEALDPGDIIILTDPYKTGSHPQDVAMVMPAHLATGELVGYAVIKAHWADTGAKQSYCSDTTDVFQEGLILPGVKLYSAGSLVKDIAKVAIANSRLPRFVEGDMNAGVAAVRTGAGQLVRLIERHGLTTFFDCVERMLDHGEALARSYLGRLPSGRYVARGEMDDDGIDDDPIPFDVAVEIRGSDVRVDFSGAPDAARGPVNCPIASTVSAARVIVTMLAGGGQAPNEGHFRPIEVVARPGSIFHCLSPSPSFLYFQPAMQASEVILRAFAEAVPEAVPASSGGTVPGPSWGGHREATGAYWFDGTPLPVGQGASRRGDGQSSRMHHLLAAARCVSVEVLESRNPWITRRCELAADSGGAGRFAGGLGADVELRFREDAFMVSTIERTKNPAWGLVGGLPGRPNGGEIRYADGSTRAFAKATGLPVPKGCVVTIRCGGGGGFGAPADRDPQAVRDDLRNGYVSEAGARRHYPHAFEAPS